MVFNYFYTIAILVGVLLLLNILNRIVFMRFVKTLPASAANLSINDLLDVKNFEKLIRNLDPAAREKAEKTRAWLIRIILSMFLVILLIIVVGVLSFIK